MDIREAVEFEFWDIGTQCTGGSKFNIVYGSSFLAIPWPCASNFGHSKQIENFVIPYTHACVSTYIIPLIADKST